jgi:hypothetical protein
VFVACAGANRRRVGVVSDINRDADREICDKVKWDWVLNDDLAVDDAKDGQMRPAGEL